MTLVPEINADTIAGIQNTNKATPTSTAVGWSRVSGEVSDSGYTTTDCFCACRARVTGLVYSLRLLLTVSVCTDAALRAVLIMYSTYKNKGDINCVCHKGPGGQWGRIRRTSYAAALRRGLGNLGRDGAGGGRYTQPLLADVGNWPRLIGGSPSIRPTLCVGQFLYHFNFWQQIKF